jgi:hypothetical protein
VTWKPTVEGEAPTLGWDVLDWIAENLAAPDRDQYEPFILTAEQARFVLGFYELDPVTGKRLIRRGVISRPRGWGKSPLLAALACVEALGPVVSAGWDADGQPVGQPWHRIRTPLVQVAAVSEKQTKNTWTPLLEMLRNGPGVDAYPGLDPMETFVNLPRGRIETVTSSATTVKGNKGVFAILDQTEEWTRTNGGHRLSEVLLNNATKIGGSTIESPNAYTPGMDSVAEKTAVAFQLMQAGKTRMSTGLLHDHREAPADTDMADRESLMAGLAVAYGDSAQSAGGWVDLETILGRIWDPDMEPQLARADFLNQVTHAADSWISQPELAAIADPTKVVADREVITLGFDGSRSRTRGKADATALIGCRLADGHLFEIGVWEQPDGPGHEGWEPPVVEVSAAVGGAFLRYRVVGFYADSSMWEEHVASWEAQYGPQLMVKAAPSHPIRWPKNHMTRVVEALTRLHNAIRNGEASYDGSFALTRHFLNARRRTGRSGVFISKEHPESPNKIDAAYASMLAWAARLEALASGAAAPVESYVPKRIR